MGSQFKEVYQRKLEVHQRKLEVHQRKLETNNEFKALHTPKERDLFFRTLEFGIQKSGTEETFTLNDRTQQLTRYFKQIKGVIHPIIPLCKKGQWKARDLSSTVENERVVVNL